MKLRRLPLKPLPLHPRLLDYLEWVFQRYTYWIVIDIEGYPCLSGLLTGILLVVTIYAPMALLAFLLWHH